MTRDEIEVCWKDPQNWKWGVYYCKTDPRAIVPKRLKWAGWTVNLARPSAIPITLLLMALLVVPLRIMSAKGATPGIVWMTATASVTILCLVCAYLSSRTK